jgi:hypothetical protein
MAAVESMAPRAHITFLSLNSHRSERGSLFLRSKITDPIAQDTNFVKNTRP